MAGMTSALMDSADYARHAGEERWLTLVPKPLPEFSPERARELSEAPAHEWTPPAGISGIF